VNSQEHIQPQKTHRYFNKGGLAARTGSAAITLIFHSIGADSLHTHQLHLPEKGKFPLLSACSFPQQPAPGKLNLTTN